MLRLTVFDASTRRWTVVENGPFPITQDQLMEARRRYEAEWYACDDLSGVKMSPQTTARAILHEVAPQLSDFDAMMIGFAVSNPRIRMETV
jgi:hypothetical protein